MNRLLCICFLVFMNQSMVAQAQKMEAKDTINQRDKYNRKQGYWIYRNYQSLDDLFSYTMYGYYIDDKKNGPWVKIDSYGKLKSEENYFKDVLNGLCKYYDKGRLILVANYRAIDPDLIQDTVSVLDPESLMEEDVVIVPSSRGSLKHGLWKYFDPTTGNLVKTELYQVDSLLRTTELYVDGYSIKDPEYKKKIEKTMPHAIDPSGNKYQHGKARRKSLIK